MRQNIIDNTESDPGLIELRHRLGPDQATLNIELGLFGMAATGSGGSTSATSASTVIEVATGGGGGTGGPCFIADTRFTLFSGQQVQMEALYEERAKYIGTFAKSFDENNKVVPGEIEDVFCTVVHEYLLATFSDNTKSGVRHNHRYFVPGDNYVAIMYLLGKQVVSEDGGFVKVTGLEIIDKPEGVKVYNARIRKYANYCADGKHVHNNKPRPDDDPFGP